MRRAIRTTLCIAALLACATSSGCYRKVVSAKGIGSDELAPRRSKPTTNLIQDLGGVIQGEE